MPPVATALFDQIRLRLSRRAVLTRSIRRHDRGARKFAALANIAMGRIRLGMLDDARTSDITPDSLHVPLCPIAWTDPPIVMEPFSSRFCVSPCSVIVNFGVNFCDGTAPLTATACIDSPGKLTAYNLTACALPSFIVLYVPPEQSQEMLNVFTVTPVPRPGALGVPPDSSKRHAPVSADALLRHQSSAR